MFRGGATGEEPPLRVINGSKTEAIAPDRLAVDPVHTTIGGPNGILRQGRGLALDRKNQAVIASDKELNAVLTFKVPEIFSPGTAAARR